MKEDDNHLPFLSLRYCYTAFGKNVQYFWGSPQIQKILTLIFLIGFSLTAWANERDSGFRKIKFQAGMLYMPSPKLRFNKTKVSGNIYSILDGSEEVNYYEGGDPNQNLILF